MAAKMRAAPSTSPVSSHLRKTRSAADVHDGPPGSSSYETMRGSTSRVCAGLMPASAKARSCAGRMTRAYGESGNWPVNASYQSAARSSKLAIAANQRDGHEDVPRPHGQPAVGVGNPELDGAAAHLHCEVPVAQTGTPPLKRGNRPSRRPPSGRGQWPCRVPGRSARTRAAWSNRRRSCAALVTAPSPFGQLPSCRAPCLDLDPNPRDHPDQSRPAGPPACGSVQQCSSAVAGGSASASARSISGSCLPVAPGCAHRALGSSR